MNDSKKSLLPALLAAGGGLAATPASAIELGQVSVQSRLGEPLTASIPYSAAPNETVADYCVTLQPGLANSGLLAIGTARISVANGVITLTGQRILREPLVALRLNVRCPYTPHLSREYMLFVDPPVLTAAAPAVEPAAVVIAEAPEAIPEPVARRPQLVQARINPGERILVQPGQTLSQIVTAIVDRPVGLWPAIAQIFAANPDAFVDNDPNRLKAGSWLDIPQFDEHAGTVTVPPAEPAPVVDAPVAQPAPAGNASAYPGISAGESATNAGADAYAAGTEIDDTTMLEPASSPAIGELRPGDVVLDTEIEPAAASDSPNVPVATLRIRETADSATNWLWWLVGTSLALVAGLFVFVRRNRGEPTPAAQAAQPLRRRSDTQEVEAVAEPEYEIEDDSPTQENLALDANLELGTGLAEGTEMDVAQDFGFAVNTHLDMELPDESSPDAVPETDIIPPPQVEESSILKSEILPDDEDYDMSVIVDATKMPQPEEVTECDLMAVVVDNTDETLISDKYTVSQEVDYQILEQDYEEELTATQALNQEIEKAAAEIAGRMEDKIAETPLASITELDVTANLHTGDVSGVQDDDPTDVNKTLNENVANDDTIEMPRSKKNG